MIRQEIKNLIEKAIKLLQREGKISDFEMSEIKVEKPEEKAHGDYATNVAMVIAKQVRKNPIEIAENLKSKILNFEDSLFDKVEVVKPGFINFFLSQEKLYKELKEILKKGEKFGQLTLGKNIKTNIEFISVNPTGELHIGHGRVAFYGDCLNKVLKKAGYQVFSEYYVNDAKVSLQIQELGKTALGRGQSYLTPFVKNLILELEPSLKKIKSEAEAGFFLAHNILENIRKFVEEKLKIKFDFWISEQNLYKEGKIQEVFKMLQSKNLVYKKEGAFWLNLSSFSQKDEVLIRKNGQPTYFLSDIAYHQYKMERGFKKIIDIWGADHQGHIPRMKAAMKILGFKGEFDVLISQIVNLKGEKISKRKGNVVSLEWLINEVGLDAARFFYLMRSLNSQMEFDLKLAKERSEKSPVYYVQYANARICSILEKCKMQISKCKMTIQSLNLLNHPSELNLIKQLIRFPEIVEDTASDYQVQRIPQYALDLASVFHQFYQECQVITNDQKLTQARLSLILATKIVLKEVLNLMGISAPEKM